MQKKVLAVVLALAMIFSIMVPMTIASAADARWVDVSAEVINGRVVITAVTDDSFNRVALFAADDTAVASCIKVAAGYTVDGAGNYVWTISVPASDEEQTYVLRGRDAVANTYKAGSNSDEFTVRALGIFESVVTETRVDKVVATITTVAEPFDRIAIFDENGAVVKYTKDSVADGDSLVWTLTFAYDESAGEYLVMARDTRTGFYNKVEAATFTVAAPVEPVISTDVVDNGDDTITFVVTTISGLYRVKVAYADEAASSIGYARTASTDNGETAVWEITVAAPESRTEYAIDFAYDNIAYARHYTTVSFGEDVIVIPDAPEAAGNGDTLIDGWYTTSDELVQLYFGGDWAYFNQYGLTLTSNALNPFGATAATIAINASDSEDVWQNKTQADFEAVLGALDDFYPVTVAGEYLGYVGVSAVYHNLVFQTTYTGNTKYFINIIFAGDAVDTDALLAQILDTIIVNVPAVHVHTVGDAVIENEVPATCTENGSYDEVVYCTECGEELSRETITVAATGHTAGNAVIENETPATCTEDGSYDEVVYCTECGEELSRETFTVEATGHDFGDWTVVTAAAIGVEGLEQRVCSACGDVETRTIDALPYPDAPDNAANAGAMADGWYTTSDGIIQLYFGDGWYDFNQYGLTLTSNVLNPFGATAATIAINPADSDDVWQNKTQADFESVLGELDDFYSVTVADEYLGYVGVSAVYHNLVFQVGDAKYFINIIYAGDAVDTDALLELVLGSVIVNACPHVNAEWVVVTEGTYKDQGEQQLVCPVCGEVLDTDVVGYVAPDETLWGTMDEDGYYITTDGAVVMKFPDTWAYFNQYGLTLTSNAASPFGATAATIAINSSDSEEVWQNKTQADFEAVLGDLDEFYPVTVADEYLGYVGVSAVYHNLVFQTSYTGTTKYFINIITAGTDGVDCDALFADLLDSIVVFYVAE